MPPPTLAPAADYAPAAAAKPFTASRGQKASWATGAFAVVFMANAFSYLAMPIYNVALKVDAKTVGWAMGLPRIGDAVADANYHVFGGQKEAVCTLNFICNGMFNASYVWSMKAGISLTLILSGYLLKGSGFDPSLPTQPEAVLTTLRLC
jgi:hypothetical protein